MTVQVRDVPLDAIRLTRANPRSDGADDLDGLTAALAAGLAQRPTLVEVAPGVFEVLLGERRVRAGRARGWTSIPAIIEPPLAPLAAHTRRVCENLHRRDLSPLDEARALKLDWLNANAEACGLADQANAALATADSVDAGLHAVAALLVASGWSACRPPVPQDAYLRQRGLGISKALLRKKLQVLNLSPAAEAHLAGTHMTAAGIRAFLRLDHADQTMLLTALADDPTLAKHTRTLVQWVSPPRRYTMAQALAILRGVVPDAAEAAPLGDTPPPDVAAAAADDAPDDGHLVTDLVLPFLETAQVVQEHLTQLARRGPLPNPWDGFVRDAATTLVTALQPLLAG